MPNFKKINAIAAFLFMFFSTITLLLAEYIPVKYPTWIIMASSLPLLVSMIVSSILSTIVIFRDLIRNKNSVLITFYSLITFFSYKLSEAYTSNLLYESLGYNPKYLPFTSSLISFFPLILTGITLTTISLMVFSVGSILVTSIFNSLIRPLFFFLNLDKLENLNDKIADLGFGTYIIAGVLFCCVNIVAEINFDYLIQRIAVEFDYHPISSSVSICNEAKRFDKFNYLSKNLISVFRYDIDNQKLIFSVINCKVV